MKRILSSTRCRLTPTHVNELMQIRVEGPPIPDVRKAIANEYEAFNTFINLAFASWKRKPHRNN